MTLITSAKPSQLRHAGGLNLTLAKCLFLGVEQIEESDPCHGPEKLVIQNGYYSSISSIFRMIFGSDPFI